jgi:hypothetical protein
MVQAENAQRPATLSFAECRGRVRVSFPALPGTSARSLRRITKPAAQQALRQICGRSGRQHFLPFEAELTQLWQVTGSALSGHRVG